MKNKTLLVVVLVGALALYLFWEDLFPSDTKTAPATSEKPSLPELSEDAKAIAAGGMQSMAMNTKMDLAYLT